jgi:hypothetical protein
VAAVLVAVLLAGCRAQGVAAQPAGGVGAPATAGAPPNGAAGAATSESAPSNAGLDSDLKTVDGQLSGIDSAMAQATADPSDGG